MGRVQDFFAADFIVPPFDIDREEQKREREALERKAAAIRRAVAVIGSVRRIGVSR